MAAEHKHRWILDFAEYDIKPAAGIVCGPYHYQCAYCPETLITNEPLANTEHEFDVVKPL